MYRDKETVAQFMERWLETYAATHINRKTQQGYRGVIGRYVIPALGSLKLQSLTARHIQAPYADMQLRGLGAPSIVATHRVLKEALGHAVKWNGSRTMGLWKVSPRRLVLGGRYRCHRRRSSCCTVSGALRWNISWTMASYGKTPVSCLRNWTGRRWILIG